MKLLGKRQRADGTSQQAMLESQAEVARAKLRRTSPHDKVNGEQEQDQKLENSQDAT